MTAEPAPLVDALDEALGSWAEPARQHLPSAKFCAAAHPLEPSILCGRLDGHHGLHTSGEDGQWADDCHPTTEETNRD